MVSITTDYPLLSGSLVIPCAFSLSSLPPVPSPSAGERMGQHATGLRATAAPPVARALAHWAAHRWALLSETRWAKTTNEAVDDHTADHTHDFPQQNQTVAKLYPIFRACGTNSFGTHSHRVLTFT
jgi:hypothetical protein